MHTRVTFGTNHRSLSGTDAADGFAPVHRTLSLKMGGMKHPEYQWSVSMEKNFNLLFFNCFPLISTIIKTDCAHTHLTYHIRGDISIWITNLIKKLFSTSTDI